MKNTETYIFGLSSVNTGLISWIATKYSLNIFFETKFGLLTYFLWSSALSTNLSFIFLKIFHSFGINTIIY